MKMNIDYTALGKRIRTSRKAKKISQEQLAEICALSAAHIGHIERGTRIPSLDTIFRISQALDVSLDYIILDSLADDSKSIVNLKSIIETMDEKTQSNIISTVKALCSYEKNN